MKELTLKRFLDWSLLGVIGLFAIVHQFIEKIELWYYSEVPITYNIESILLLASNFGNLLVIICTAFYIIRWLNSFLSWSSKNVFYRIIIEIVLFTIVSNLWLLLFNQVYIYVKIGYIFGIRDIILTCTTGTIINFIIVPLVELSIMFYYKYETDINSKQLQIENEQFKYEILKNQVNPHFLFNSLSVLNSLISIDQNQAKIFTHNFSSVLRNVLDFKFTDSISLSDEKDFIEQYIYLLKTRFGDALQVDLSFPETYLNKNILPMVLQLLIENVIKHNKVVETQPMCVSIIANSKGISVSNPIQLKSSVSSWGIGLENIKSRYARMGHTIEVKNDQETFSIFIPYI